MNNEPHWERVYIDGKPTTYMVDPYGRVLQTKTGILLKPRKHYLGYVRYSLSFGHRKTAKQYYAHRLVANAFLENPLRLKEINHIDGDKTNNSLENLEWSTRKNNIQHAEKTGLANHPVGESANTNKLSNNDVAKIRKDLLLGRSCTSIAKEYNLARTTISAIKNGRTWTHNMVPSGT